MKITFYGGASEVTGSKYLVEIGNAKILLDCGFFQGHRQETKKLNSSLPFDPKTIDAVILSHAHLDHCGMLPQLVKNGYQGNFYATAPTKDIAEWILLDAAHIQEMDADYMNRHNISGKELSEPLFTKDDIPNVMGKFIDVPYVRDNRNWQNLPKNIRCKFYDAGHILGSATIVLEGEDNNKIIRIAYTGDLGRKGMPILNDPAKIEDTVESLILESTYGGRTHQPIEEAISKLKESIILAHSQKSKIIVPAFSLGRTQELIYTLHQLTDKNQIPRIPIYIDSPLAKNITDVFKKHYKYFDKESQKEFGSKGELPLAFRNLKFTASTQDSKNLNNISGPFLVITASGMCEAGRILHHLKNTIEDPNNMILITGFQAENTLCRRIQDGAEKINIFGSTYKVNAKIIILNEFSAHADVVDLENYSKSISGLKRIFLVHGEFSQMQSLKERLNISNPNWQVSIPQRGESFKV